MDPQESKSPRTEAARQFETALGELQQIVSQLEQGNLTLSQSLEAYEQGVGRLKTCYQGLKEVEQQIRILTKVEPDGSVHWEAFDATESAATTDGQAPRATRKKPRAPKGTSDDSPEPIQGAASNAALDDGSAQSLPSARSTGGTKSRSADPSEDPQARLFEH